MDNGVNGQTKGREAATQAALANLVPRLHRFARVLTGDAVEADDVVQAACERALTRLHQWDPDTRLDSWMFRIVQTTWIDRCRAEATRRPSGSWDEALDVASDDGRIVAETRLTLAAVRKQIAKLPDEQRAVLALVSIDGASYRQASDALGIPIGTVMSRLARARRTLADALERYIPAPIKKEQPDGQY